MSVGFTDPRVLEGHVIEVKDEKLQELLGEATLYSITYRLFKLPAGRLETLCEDYGQYAVYKGTIEGNPNAYSLDDHHRLETGNRCWCRGEHRVDVRRNVVGETLRRGW